MFKLTEDEKAKVVEEIKKLAKENNFGLTDNAERIAGAKLRFFGIDDWKKCPCVNDGEHACISPKCREQIENEGVCHCNLFKKNKEGKNV